ncbi:MAG: NADH-quinone oxidoreductase subunit M [Desulfobacteraceae bacterium]|nr:NADH-quinone oxidoreductase subunit M [Desulfobacteraceae bacterium]
MSGSFLLTTIVFLPLAGAFAALALRRNAELCRIVSLITAAADLLLVVSLYFFDLKSGATGNWLLIEDHSWIPGLGVRYLLAMDGISLLLITLTAFIGVLTVLVSWKQIDEKVGTFHFFLLAMQTGVLGVFLAMDLLLFYFFWEFQLIPMFFLIGIWGHEERVRATVKFVMYSIAGSLLMLIALISLYLQHGAGTGVYTFSLFELAGSKLSAASELLIYSAFLLAFAIKIPVFPLHSWLPDAHTEAPTAGSVILAGLLLKTGVYAVLRFAFPLFPNAAAASVPVLLVIGLIGLFYASWIAYAQKDMKRLVAYSSIAHMGLIVIGLAVWNMMTVSGAVLQMVNHGITTGALFILVGMLDERIRTRQLAETGGIWKKMPIFSAFFLFFSMSTIGLPGLNNFVGEILILVGTFRSSPVVAIIGFGGIVLVLPYALRLVQETLYGPSRGECPVWDINGREAAILAPLAAVSVFIGFYPGPLLDLVQGPVHAILSGTGNVFASLP